MRVFSIGRDAAAQVTVPSISQNHHRRPCPWIRSVRPSSFDKVSQNWDNHEVRRVPAADEKPLHWVAAAKRDFLSFPVSVKEDMGNALGIAQFGGTAPTAKP